MCNEEYVVFHKPLVTRVMSVCRDLELLIRVTSTTPVGTALIFHVRNSYNDGCWQLVSYICHKEPDHRNKRYNRLEIVCNIQMHAFPFHSIRTKSKQVPPRTDHDNGNPKL